MSQPFNLSTFEGFEKLPKKHPGFGVDVGELQKKYGTGDNRRVARGSFRIPLGASQRVAAQITRQAGYRWIEAMKKQGWELISEVRANDRGLRADPITYELMHGFQFVATFAKVNAKPARLEIPLGIVKRESDHRISLREAVKALS